MLLGLTLVAAGCGGTHTATPPAALPANAIVGLKSRERTLPAPALVAEALDHTRLAQLLEQRGYVAGSEREFYGRSLPFSHVTARTLQFADERGAAAFLSWAQKHAVDTVGALRSKRPLRIGDGGAILRARGCGCHGEAPTFLALWRHGARVFWLLASGEGATGNRVTALAHTLDATTASA